MVLQNIDTCASGIKEVEVVANELDIVQEYDTYVKCKKCGSNGARIHYEEWSDGMTYSDYGCSVCGFWEVVD